MDKIKNVLSSTTAVKAEKPIKLYSHAGVRVPIYDHYSIRPTSPKRS
jgi:hypothetical protein